MDTTITVNLKEKSFTISGTEEFVEKNIQELKDFITMNMKYEENVMEENGLKKEKSISITEEQDKYIKHGIYAVDSEDGTVTILKKIPGKNNAENTGIRN